MIRTKGVYADGMVVQHNKTSKVQGVAQKNSTVTLEYRGQKLSAKTDSQGAWGIEFNGEDAGGPFAFKLSCGEDSLEYQIYSGEVWVNSGQSNAQLPMERMKFTYPDEFALPENPLIRMVTVPITWNYEGESDDFFVPLQASNDGAKIETEAGTGAGAGVEGTDKAVIPVKWDAASHSTLGGMSGTAYFFAKRLAAELKMPVGIINASQGGSPISSWLSKEALGELTCGKDFLEELKKYETPSAITAKQKEMKENQQKWDSELYAADQGIKNAWEKLDFEACKADVSWSECTIPGFLDGFSGAGIVWIKKEITLTASQIEHFNSHQTWLWLGTIVDADKAFVNGTQVGVTYYCYPPRRYPVPAGLLHEGKNTITLRLQKNSSFGKIRFYEEKPYFLFTDNVKIAPCASRNVENFTEVLPSDGEKIALSGKWIMKAGCSVRDCPPGMFFEWIPTALYNGMLSPCFGQAVAGALWYQGESDAGRASIYKELLLKMMDLWRKKFVYADKDMPFVVIQLPNWSDGNAETSVFENGGWAYIRDSQAAAVKADKNTALVVAIDAGEWNDLHPEKKRTTGTRAGEQALRLAYKKNFAPVSVFEAAEVEKAAAGTGKVFVAAGSAGGDVSGSVVKVHFDCGGSSLKSFAIKSDGKSADFTKESDAVHGFAVYGEKNGKSFVKACDAKLTGKAEVAVTIPADCDGAKELRYLWTDSPAPINLYNAEVVPVAPFMWKIK